MSSAEVSSNARPTERRAYRRAKLDVPAMLDAGSSWHAGRCRDVCAGGVAVSTDASFATGAVLEVYFELPSGVAVETQAEVVYSGQGRIGLRFVDLDSASRLALRSYCRLSGIQPASRASVPSSS